MRTVVEARGVHALPAPLALAAAGMDLHADAFADCKLVDIRSERGNRAHIFMTGCEIFVEWQAALNARGRAGVDDLEVGCADGDRVDADQNLRVPRNGRRLVAQHKLIRVAQNPSFHPPRNRKFG